MKVAFKSYGAHLASSRLRSIIPAQQLHALGVGTGKDWLVIGKHGWSWEQETQGFARVCFDVCDNWFNRRWDQHYRQACKDADLVTCSSNVLKRAIAQETGRDAAVIPEPFEQPEKPARIHDSLLWFGFRTNLADLQPLLPLPKLEIVSNVKHESVTEWSPEAMDAAYDRAGLVLIPTAENSAKSGNRAVDCIRRGIYPIAGPLEAYSDLGIWQGDIKDGIAWALSHRAEVLMRIKHAQTYVKHEYSPQKIGRKWRDVLLSAG